MRSRRLLCLVLFLACLPNLAAPAEDRVEHVLLISVDGLHALDVARYVRTHPDSALAELTGHGVTYTNARTPANSDSFPGLLALVTGGSPITTGLFYDVSYDRAVFAPTDVNCSHTPGFSMIFDESIDAYDDHHISQNVIDPTALPRHRVNGHCVPLFPHEALRTNTIFEVARAAGKHTAWADKHPAYDLVNGPSGHGVEDLYTPEITNVDGPNATVSVVCTVRNDQLKVQGVLHQIHGRRHDGSHGPGVPAIFGMNFQAVSVGQKLATDNNVPPTNPSFCPNDPFTGQHGGYLDGDGTPSEVLSYGLDQTDDALRSMIDALREQGIYESTLFIVTAKHGQSPINPLLVNKPGHFADLVAALPDGMMDPAALAIAAAAACDTDSCPGFVQDDDVAFIWLGNQSQTEAVRHYLNLNASALFIEQVMAGDEITLRFNNPLNDSRAPDVVVQPVYGTIYTMSSRKNAEHGGFSFGDTNVGLIVSNPELRATVIKTPVATSQVAPSILRALGLNPNALRSVRVEKTPELPGLERVNGDSQ